MDGFSTKRTVERGGRGYLPPASPVNNWPQPRPQPVEGCGWPGKTLCYPRLPPKLPRMALTPSTMLPLGTPCPDFDLYDTVGGNLVSRQDFSTEPLLVMFICNHCPFVKHVAPE